MSEKSGITHVRTVTITVTDQDTALAFYGDVLGFETRVDAPFGDGGRWIEVAPPEAHTTVALLAAHDDVVAGGDSGVRLTATNAEAEHRRLSALGVDVDSEVMHWPGVPPMFSFGDPDGNRLY